jgi:hypothetical protein
MENLKSILKFLAFIFIFLNPIGWVVAFFLLAIRLHPVYWLYRIAKAIESKNN